MQPTGQNKFLCLMSYVTISNIVIQLTMDSGHHVYPTLYSLQPQLNHYRWVLLKKKVMLKVKTKKTLKH